MNKTDRTPWLDGAYILVGERQTMNNSISNIDTSNGSKYRENKATLGHRGHWGQGMTINRMV